MVCSKVDFFVMEECHTLTETTTISTSGSLAMASGLLYALLSGIPWALAAALADSGDDVARAVMAYFSDKEGDLRGPA